MLQLYHFICVRTIVKFLMYANYLVFEHIKVVQINSIFFNEFKSFRVKEF